MDFTTSRRQVMPGALGATALSAQAGREIRTGFIGVGIRRRSLVPQVLEESNTRVTPICDFDANCRSRKSDRHWSCLRNWKQTHRLECA